MPFNKSIKGVLKLELAKVPNWSVEVVLVHHSDEDQMMGSSVLTYIMVIVLRGTLSCKGKLDVFPVTSSMFGCFQMASILEN